MDRCLEATLVVEGLRDAGVELRVHRDYFADDEKDEVWLPDVAQRGWVVLTRDEKIRRRPIEKQALVASGARVFVLTAKDLRGQEMANLLVKHLKRIERLARKTDPPFVATINRGSVALLPDL